MSAPPTVRLRKDLRRNVLRGHPWLYDRALDPLPRQLAPGDLVTVADARGPLAIGYADPGAPIAVRLLATEPGARLDGDWVEERVARCARRRVADPALAETDAVRWVNGEGDGAPGLVVDVYAGLAIAIVDGAGAAAFWGGHRDRVRAGLERGGAPVTGLWMRPTGRQRRWIGEPPPELAVVRENGATFEVDLRRGQKTGLFLDQRDNRRLVRDLAAGAEVLNLFGYTGGFSVLAGIGGARRVATVDVAAPAIEAARRNVRASGLDPAAHELVAADAFEWLDRATASGRRFDLVVCDPPSFAPSERARQKALGAYRRLNEQVLGVVAPGGVLCSASCSSHVGADDLLGCLAEAARGAGRELVVRSIRGAASDHMVHPAFPEGRYLDFLVCAVD